MDRRTVLLNAFRPALELDDPSLFAGRETEVKNLTDALRERGSIPLIYGSRGLGKSSLALQMSHIAEGGVELLSQFGAEDFALPEAEHYVPVRVSCTGATKNLDNLLQILINAAGDIEFEARETGGKHSSGRTRRIKLNLKLVEVETQETIEVGDERPDYQVRNLEETLTQLCTALVEASGKSVLFIITSLTVCQIGEGLPVT
ncbi:MAG: hypothetical protein ACRDPQ_14005 [Nocardioidaceae bacterium]